MEHLTKLHSNGRLLALPANIRLRWKSMAVANTLAYYIKATITAVKSFIVQAAGKKNYKGQPLWLLSHIRKLRPQRVL